MYMYVRSMFNFIIFKKLFWKNMRRFRVPIFCRNKSQNEKNLEKIPRNVDDILGF